MMNKKICCFIGYEKIKNEEEVEKRVILLVENLINQGVDIFLFSGSSKFSDICFYVVLNFKKKYPNIKLLEYYSIKSLLGENTYSIKKSYITRDIEMINDSDVCVFHYENNHLCPKRKKRFNFTQIAYEYAKNKKKAINISNI